VDAIDGVSLPHMKNFVQESFPDIFIARCAFLVEIYLIKGAWPPMFQSPGQWARTRRRGFTNFLFCLVKTTRTTNGEVIRHFDRIARAIPKIEQVKGINISLPFSRMMKFVCFQQFGI
jgi:hypothetical protein